MKLDDLFEEASAGAVSAHSAAGFRGSLFSGGVLTPAAIKRKIPKVGQITKLKFNKRKKVAGVDVIKYNGED